MYLTTANALHLTELVQLTMLKASECADFYMSLAMVPSPSLPTGMFGFSVGPGYSLPPYHYYPSCLPYVDIADCLSLRIVRGFGIPSSWHSSVGGDVLHYRYAASLISLLLIICPPSALDSLLP